MFEHHVLAPTPPMGWNSFDCYDLTVTEEDVLGNAEYMARHLSKYGYEYVVIDGSWYDPASAAWGRSDIPLVTDEYGRYVPCPAKFPSSAGGCGFKPLADRIHGLGLKFGIHIMRGISRQAVRANTPLPGSPLHAQDFADTGSICSWWEQSYGIDTRKDGAQEWYDANFAMYAEWGVDFVKADDMSSPYAKAEIECVCRAIERCGRPMVLSLSPGQTPLSRGEHVSAHANMWRISGDFFDTWPQLLEMFDLLEKWVPWCGPGHWPDADMLPLGIIGIRRNPPKLPRFTRFALDEQRQLMTLWCIARSPLFFGGDMRVLDPWTLSLLTNRDVLAMHARSSGNRVLYHEDYRVAWTARGANGESYIALFNLSDREEVQMSASVADCGAASAATAMELWSRETSALVEGRISTVVPPHGVRLYRVEEHREQTTNQ